MPRHVRQLSQKQLMQLGAPADGIPLLTGKENFLEWDQALKAKLKVLSMDHLLVHKEPSPARPDPSSFDFSTRKGQGAYATACHKYYRGRYEHGHTFATIKLSIHKDIFNTLETTAPYDMYRQISDRYAPVDSQAFSIWTNLRFQRDESKDDFVRKWKDARCWAGRRGAPISPQCAVTTFLMAVSAFAESWDFAQSVLNRVGSETIEEDVIEEWIKL